ncbi:MAG: hypothetical protein EON52_08875 [Actinomycetales bacterium]|nr:MAG: hypothetical protein EON52_08875 [Actinomycetales bacterium]
MRSSGNWSRPLLPALLAVLALTLTACGSSGEKGDEPAAKASKTTSSPKAPAELTEQSLADALPDDDYFPKGSLVTVRCPGDAPCDTPPYQATAALVVSPELPAGAQADTSGLDERAKYRVAGGEWDEEIKLRAWLYSTDAEPAAYIQQYSGELEKLGRTVDVAPKKTDNGYNYGSRGTREYKPLTINGWKGFYQVQRVTYIHLGGRETEPRFVVYAALAKGKVYTRVDTSNTVQGRDQADAVKAVTDLLEDYTARIDG